MKLSEVINTEHLNPLELAQRYQGANPFAHIVLDNFISRTLIENVLLEFPDLSTLESRIQFDNQHEIKFASQGFQDISESASKLIGVLNSDIFLHYLSQLTGIRESLISDPYLSGGGYHEIKNGGVLKVHVDFNKHRELNLDRRINLLLYLNKDWDPKWGGNLELYAENDLSKPVKTITPIFNRCVIFSTDSHSYHGHPEPINCPEEKTRKSVALYYFSNGRPESESTGKHSTIFVETKGENFNKPSMLKKLARDLIPPVVYRGIKKLFG